MGGDRGWRSIDRAARADGALAGDMGHAGVQALARSSC